VFHNVKTTILDAIQENIEKKTSHLSVENSVHGITDLIINFDKLLGYSNETHLDHERNMICRKSV